MFQAPPPSSPWPSAWPPRIYLTAAPQAHIVCPAALAPAGHPVGIGLRALAGLLDLLHLPYGQVLQPSLQLEGLGLCQGRFRLSLQSLCLLAGHGCASDLLLGSGVPGQLPGDPLQGLPAITGGVRAWEIVLWHFA